MREPEDTAEQTFTPGDHVTVTGAEAQAAAGGDHGIVVGSTGDTRAAGTGKVVVALDRSPSDAMGNAVIAPADLQAAAKDTWTSAVSGQRQPTTACYGDGD